MGYTWAVGAFRNTGSFHTTPPGYGGSAFSPGAVGAPSTTSKLVRCGLSMSWSAAGTATGVLIAPNWAALQSGYVCAAVQAAGDTTVPSPTDPAPTDFKVNQTLELTQATINFTNSQGGYVLQTDGLTWSQGEAMTPPAGGLQVRPSWVLNDATGGTAGFGSSSNWHYELMLRVLWFTP